MNEPWIVAVLAIFALGAIVFLLWYAARGADFLNWEGDPWH